MDCGKACVPSPASRLPLPARGRRTSTRPDQTACYVEWMLETEPEKTS